MFSRKKVPWKPKHLPEATVRQVTVVSTTKRKRATDSPVASSSIHAAAAASSRQEHSPRLPVPSPPRKKRIRSPATNSSTPAMSRLSSDSSNADSEEEPDDVFARFNQSKARLVREDPTRGLPNVALKALDKACYASVSGQEPQFVHACEVVSLSSSVDDRDEQKNGKRVVKQADKVFPLATDDESTIELQYPGSLTRERFHLVDQKDKLDVIKDILKIVKNVRSFYIKGEEDEKLFDGPNGIIQRLRRGAGWSTNNGTRKKDIAGFRKAVDDYNEIVLRRLTSGATLEVISKEHVLPDELVVHIMAQLYARIISPSVDKLKVYTNGTDHVYGEMKPEFITQVLCSQTKMSSQQTFVDLGSGVGNVVLQAALQIGCKSWGCEYMNTPASLAKAQLKEFKARCQLWGIQPGEVHLLHGDFQDHERFPKLYHALKHADVVVTNNKAFTPELNARLSLIFLELKNGCRIVSLTDFSAASRHNTNDIAYALSQADEHKWREKWVSWTDEEGLYYITSRI